MESLLNNLWLVPALPLLGSFLLGVTGRRLGKAGVNALGVGSAGLSFAVALGVAAAFSRLAVSEIPYSQSYFTWISAGSLQIDFSFHLDQLSLVMMLIVTGVGFLIHLYSAGYMAHEGGYYRFFSYLNLFLFFMLILVLAGNYAVMFVGWEGVGLCSYLLIGFFFLREAASNAGKKAFLVNRIGDFGFLLAMFLLFQRFGSLDFSVLFPAISNLEPEPATLAGASILTVSALLLFVGAAGKSAQVPLYVWLPDAMEGPAPVSALIHAATMVTAGVYMIARSSVLFSHAPLALLVVAVIGAATALFAATIGLVQTDIKRVLAYSTVSQLGYMFLALGVGAYTAAIFHLMTHAFFKALLFLGAGSVIHALGGRQDMREMGGLRKRIPVTYWTFLLATLAIVGAPGFSGFFSKDEILWKTFGGGHIVLYAVGMTAAALTAFYMFRLLFLTFHGAPRYPEAAARNIHESPWTMTMPLTLLAILSVIGGWVGIPAALWELVPEPYRGSAYFEHFLAPVLSASERIVNTSAVAHSYADERLLMGVAVLTAFAGFLIALWLYVLRPALADRLAGAFSWPHKLLLNKYLVDELYSAVIVRPLHWFSDKVLWRVFDVEIVDGLVNGAATQSLRFGRWARSFQGGNVRSYASWILAGATALVTLFLGFLR